jgi:hypothetical protein
MPLSFSHREEYRLSFLAAVPLGETFLMWERLNPSSVPSLMGGLTPTCGLFSLPLYAWLFVMFAATSLREKTVLLNFTVEAL